MYSLLQNLIVLLGIYIGTYLLLYFAGLGASLLLLPKRFSRWFLFITPIVGFSLLTAIPQALSFLKWPSANMLWLIVGLCSVINLVAVRRIKLIKVPKAHLKIFAVHFIFLLILSIPLIAKGLQTITINSDVLVYTTSADYAQQYGLVEQNTDSNTFDASGYNWFIKNEKRLGLVYFQGFMNILFDTNSMESYLPLSLLTISLSILGGIIFSQHFKLFRQKTIMLMMFLLFFNTLYMSSVFIGFLSMNAVMPVLILCLIVGKYFMDHMHQFDLPKTIYLAFLTGSVLATHPTYLIYILSILGMYFIASLFFKKRASIYNRISLKSMLTFLLCFIIVFFKPVYLFIQRMIPTFLPAVGSESGVETAAGIGNIHFLVPIYELLGVVPHSHEEVSLMKWKGYRELLQILIGQPKITSVLSTGIEIISYLFLFVALFLIFIYFAKKRARARLFNLCIIVTMSASLSIGFLQKYYYGYYKSLHLLSFFFIIWFCAAIEIVLTSQIKIKTRSATRFLYLFVSVIVVVNLSSTTILTKRYMGYMDDFESKHYLELRLLSDSLTPRDKLLLYEEVPNHIRQMSVNFFVRSPQLYLRTSIDTFKAEARNANTNSGYFIVLPNNHSLLQHSNGSSIYRRGEHYSIIQL
ncbi:hypothetical protein DFP94_10519 [Fontibacillus phaseoli]|uniref:Uncharacterized protein n=1 Tax=Fontibacillus phaseoli TaxID=1416533 RepID=A0A369BBV0_9BACL|nr:hypothetical protein [Fontibacillus phaseoli]RCX19003.1 hypothetical protein DFP94_10519 [Fontibacillus phaseoli]